MFVNLLNFAEHFSVLLIVQQTMQRRCSFHFKNLESKQLFVENTAINSCHLNFDFFIYQGWIFYMNMLKASETISKQTSQCSKYITSTDFSNSEKNQHHVTQSSLESTGKSFQKFQVQSLPWPHDLLSFHIKATKQLSFSTVMVSHSIYVLSILASWGINTKFSGNDHPHLSLTILQQIIIGFC